MPLGQIVPYAVLFVVTWVSIAILERAWGALTTVFPQVAVPVRKAQQYYFGFFRKHTPDWIYRLWYRTGIIDAETYRTFQDRGYISCDLDPEYLQRDDFKK